MKAVETMNPIRKLFREKQGNILSVYFTAGYPALDSTSLILRELGAAGVDMIEIGIPFSDPLADGPTIQRSSEVALKNGMSLKLLFRQLKEIPSSEPRPVLILMGYLNPVMQYGMENFCRDAAACGISGIILPDLPPDVYEREYKQIFEKYGLSNILLITPQTSEARIRRIDAASDGFIYMVSSDSTTGAKKGITPVQEEYFRRIQSLGLKNPLVAGFGISDRESYRSACRFASGAIIGSAFINAIGGGSDLKSKIHAFIKSIR